MYLAIDLGGTYLKFGVLCNRGDIHFKGRTATPKGTFKDLSACISDIFSTLSKQYLLEGISLSLPGAVNAKGAISDLTSMQSIQGINIKEALEVQFKLPVVVENDANCAALAEIKAGCAQHCKDIILVVCGTGVGGAIIKDRSIHKGSHLLSGEFGMLINYDHASQHRQSFSWLASTGNMVNRASKATGRKLTGPDVFNLAAAGNTCCQAEIEAFYAHLAVLLTNLQCVYDPELIVISGGISERRQFAAELEQAIQHINKLRGSLCVETKVTTAHFRNDAHLIGALFNFIETHVP